MRQGISVLGWVVLLTGTTAAAELKYKDRLLGELVKQVPGILRTFDAQTGRFGTGIWTCQDQQSMYPLAVAYARPGKANRYYKDRALLQVIAQSADPLLKNRDSQGRWLFQKKDGSTWGMIFMPWTYSRWIRTFSLVSDDLPPETRKTWSEALILGYGGISKAGLGASVHNIGAHHAMGLYIAGQAFHRPEWCRQAAAYLARVVAAQAEGGYWAEGGGPVVLYDFVYVEALGIYFALSRDARTLAALEKAASFHRHFTYPGGQDVETIDQRNPYHDTIELGNVGFTFNASGRGYLQKQWTHRGSHALDADRIASLLLYGEEGPFEEWPASERVQTFVLREGKIERAATIRRGPWFVCLSAYSTPVAESRWHQDRQNFVSIYHEKTGLILGGGNTKLQPAWSNFTVGDMALLSHTPGDRNPRFRPRGELYHVPSAARLVLPSLSAPEGGKREEAGVDLTYGPEHCGIRVRLQDDRTLDYLAQCDASGKLPVAAHLTLLPRLHEPVVTAAGEKVRLDTASLSLPTAKIGEWIAHAGYRLRLPTGVSLHWPALPHNPYRIDGRADLSEGRLEIRIPLDREHRQQRVILEVDSPLSDRPRTP